MSDGLSEGARLLFGTVRNWETQSPVSSHTLTPQQMNAMFTQMELRLSADKRGFYGNDECAVRWRDTFNVYLIDLNADQQPEVMVDYGNYCEFGNEGGSLTIFSLQNGKYVQVFSEIGSYYPAKGTTMGYKNFILGGPGLRRPLMKWNGKKYVSSGDVDFGG